MNTTVESYVVRIYRCQSGTKRHLVGLVDAPQLTGSQAFTNVDQLWAILSGSTARRQPKDRVDHTDRENS